MKAVSSLNSQIEIMNWTPVLIIGAIVVFFIVMKRSGQISARDARLHWQQGALVVDVRSPGEFNSGHLPAAINLPLDEITAALPQREADKNRVILLHCQSGMRSGLAKSKLKALGYAQVFNLGSYGRAEKILNQSSSFPPPAK